MNEVQSSNWEPGFNRVIKVSLDDEQLGVPLARLHNFKNPYPAGVVLVEQKFATGRYGSREEVLIQTLEWLREERQLALAGIRQGLSVFPQGEPTPVHRLSSNRVRNTR